VVDCREEFVQAQRQEQQTAEMVFPGQPCIQQGIQTDNFQSLLQGDRRCNRTLYAHDPVELTFDGVHIVVSVGFTVGCQYLGNGVFNQRQFTVAQRIGFVDQQCQHVSEQFVQLFNFIRQADIQRFLRVGNGVSQIADGFQQ